MPLIVVAVGYRYVKKRIMATVAAALKKQMDAAGFRPPPGPGRADSPRGDGSAPVIDLCPKCGGYLAAGHRCQR